MTHAASDGLALHAGTRSDARSEFSLRALSGVLAAGACYYLATRIAWVLCFPDSKVSLFFPPHAVLISILLLVPTRHWWAFTLAAACSHYFATQQAHWPPLYALHCEVFDAVQNVITSGQCSTAALAGSTEQEQFHAVAHTEMRRRNVA